MGDLNGLLDEYAAEEVWSGYEPRSQSAASALNALREILEIHKPVKIEGSRYCGACRNPTYPCATVKAIETRMTEEAERRSAWRTRPAKPPAKFAPRKGKTLGGFPYRQHPHDLSGSNVERQQVGDPGHCEDCCSVGHVVAHPDLGCGDVGCYRTHD